MNGWEIVASFVFGLLVNEMTDVSPWAARRLVHWAAYRWTPDPEIAAGYAEEWTAIIEEQPGKLLKLLTAVQFSIGAARKAAPRTLVSANDVAVRKLADRLGLPAGEVRYMIRFAGVSLMVVGGAATVVGIVAMGLDSRQQNILMLSAVAFGFVVGAATAVWLLTRHRRLRVLKR